MSLVKKSQKRKKLSYRLINKQFGNHLVFILPCKEKVKLKIQSRIPFQLQYIDDTTIEVSHSHLDLVV